LARLLHRASALKKAPPVDAMLVLGDLSVQGNIKGLRSLAEPLQLATDNGAKRARIESRRLRVPKEDRADMLDDVAGHFEKASLVFQRDQRRDASLTPSAVRQSGYPRTLTQLRRP